DREINGVVARVENEPPAEMQPARVVLVHREDELDILEPRLVAALVELPAGDRRPCTFGGRLGIAQVDEAVLGELRMKRDVEEAALAGIRSADVTEGVRNAFHWNGELALPVTDAQISRVALRHEVTAVRQQREAPGVIESGCDGLDSNTNEVRVDDPM